MTVTNRLAGFFDDTALAIASPNPRSLAQQAASRRNGAFGRGPVTDLGKSKSRLNALKHGLLGLVAATHDPKDFHRPLRRIRSRLIEEFGGEQNLGFIQTCLVDSLAHDVLQAARARRMIEQHHLKDVPNATSHRDQNDVRGYERLEQCRKPLAEAVTALAKRKAF